MGKESRVHVLGLPWVDLDGAFCRMTAGLYVYDELTVRLIADDRVDV